LPAFTGGWVGYAGYDTVRYLESEKLAAPPADDRGLPDLHLQLYLQTVVFDHVQKTVMVLTHVDSNAFEDSDSAYAQVQRDLDELEARLLDDDRSPLPTPRAHVGLSTATPDPGVSNMPAGGYASRSVSNARPRPTRLTCTARCGWLTPRRTCSICKPAARCWWGRAPRFW